MPRTTDPKIRLHVWVAQKDKDWLEKEAERTDRSVSSIVRDLCRDRQLQDYYDQAARDLAAHQAAS